MIFKKSFLLVFVIISCCLVWNCKVESNPGAHNNFVGKAAGGTTSSSSQQQVVLDNNNLQQTTTPSTTEAEHTLDLPDDNNKYCVYIPYYDQFQCSHNPMVTKEGLRHGRHNGDSLVDVVDDDGDDSQSSSSSSSPGGVTSYVRNQFFKSTSGAVVNVGPNIRLEEFDELSPGVPQRVDGTDSEKLKIRQVFQLMDRYWYSEVLSMPEYDTTIRNKCKNRNELCSYWAAIGECESNRIFMIPNCAPACRLCLLQNTNIG